MLEYRLAELILLHNPADPDVPLHSEISELVQWVDSDSDRPILITSKRFGGKKVLISEFIRYLNLKSKAHGRI